MEVRLMKARSTKRPGAWPEVELEDCYRPGSIFLDLGPVTISLDHHETREVIDSMADALAMTLNQHKGFGGAENDDAGDLANAIGRYTDDLFKLVHLAVVAWEFENGFGSGDPSWEPRPFSDH